MKGTSVRHCWDITNCRDKEDCPAFRRPETPCWEIARELNDYRTIYKVCEDCIVFLSKQTSCFLTAQEIESIMAHKGICPLDTEARTMRKVAAQM